MGLMDHIINPILIFLSPCLFNLYAEYIMRNAGLDEAQAGIKITGRNINNFREADDTGSQIVWHDWVTELNWTDNLFQSGCTNLHPHQQS